MATITKKCEYCGNPFTKYASRCKQRACRFCSKKCELAQKSIEWKENNPMKEVDRSGENNPMYGRTPWNYKPEGSKRKDGYWRIQIDNKRVLKHRYLMEQKLGRRLKVNEVVHHIDGNQENNNLDNLQLLISQSQHFALHKDDLSEAKENRR